jgi:hypothetical protein
MNFYTGDTGKLLKTFMVLINCRFSPLTCGGSLFINREKCISGFHFLWPVLNIFWRNYISCHCAGIAVLMLSPGIISVKIVDYSA